MLHSFSVVIIWILQVVSSKLPWMNSETIMNYNTGCFTMFSVITNIYNKKTEGPTLMELFTATGKLKKVFLQLEMFDVCTTGNTVHIDTIFKFLPHTRQHGCIDILHCCNDPCLFVSEVMWQWWDVLRTSLYYWHGSLQQ
jgi:hypothetical protein